MLSPLLFSACYLDDLLVKLRESDLGCHLAGIWIGACCYCDDLCLLAPNAHVLQKMVELCEEYAAAHNIVFSTDPNPSQSKTKCLVFTGKNTAVSPPSIKLDGMILPWVEKVEHLGHILHQSMSTDYDARRAAAGFMWRASNIRDELHFAHPLQKMEAINFDRKSWKHWYFK